MKSTPKTNPGTSKLWQVSSEIWPGNPFSGNKPQPPTICPSIMAPRQFSFLHPEKILFALQFFYKQYRSLPLNVSLPQSYSLMYIYLFFSPLPAITLSPYWLTKVISRAVEMEGGGGKWDSNHYKSQSAKNSHQAEAFTPKTNTGSSVRNFCYLFCTEWTWKLQHWAAAQVLYSWFVCDTIPCCINTAAVTVETFSFPCWLTSRQLIPVLNSQLWMIISFQLENSLHPAYPPLSSPTSLPPFSFHLWFHFLICSPD